MNRVKKAPKPTHLQAAWLRRIAQSSMMKTYGIYGETYFSLAANGDKIPTPVADALIKHGWVKGQRDGMFDDAQSYVVLKPPIAEQWIDALIKDGGAMKPDSVIKTRLA